MRLSDTDRFRVVEDLPSKGAGLFAARRFETGERIYAFDYWSEPLTPMHVTNHSCDANGTFVDGFLVAVRPIAPGEEITFDYTAHPLPASPWDFACGCGAANCAGRVRMGAAAERES